MRYKCILHLSYVYSIHISYIYNTMCSRYFVHMFCVCSIHIAYIWDMVCVHIYEICIEHTQNMCMFIYMRYVCTSQHMFCVSSIHISYIWTYTCSVYVRYISHIYTMQCVLDIMCCHVLWCVMMYYDARDYLKGQSILREHIL